LLDTNNANAIVETDVFDPFISDHSVISGILTYLGPKYEDKTIEYRNFKATNYGDLGKDITILELDVDLENDVLSQLINEFSASLIETFDRHAPRISKVIPVKEKKNTLSESTIRIKGSKRCCFLSVYPI
jgi:hypothetical protein